MSLNIDELKKKIIYRSNYRGTKEMDKLLGKFVKKYINDLQKEDLIDLDKFLNIDDTNLYNFYNGFDTEFETAIDDWLRDARLSKALSIIQASKAPCGGRARTGR